MILLDKIDSSLKDLKKGHFSEKELLLAKEKKIKLK